MPSLRLFGYALSLGLLAGCAVPSARLVGHWRLDDDASARVLADQSGFGRQAALGGGAGTCRDGGVKAVFFSGVAESFADVDVPALADFSVAAWVNVAGMGSGDKPYPRVIELPGGFLHVTRQEPGRLGLTLGAGGGIWSGAGETFGTGVWVHVAATYAGSAASNAPVFYVNGKRVPFVSGKPPARGVAAKAGKATLGNTGSRNRPFHGLMSDVRLYEGALSPREAALLARRAPDGQPPRAAKILYKDELPVADISGWRRRQAVIAAGTKEIYQGHPTTLLMPDGRTMFCVWCVETWRRLDDTLPPGFGKHRNCPSLYRIVDPAGTERLWVFSSSHGMDRLMSADGGNTWRELPPLGFRCGMPFTGMIRLKDGRTAAFGQMGVEGKGQGVVMSVTSDGGLTWTQPRVLARQKGKDLCEPFVLRSPDGGELCCLIRENFHTANSMMCFSRDEGETWTAPAETPWGLTGDRHAGVQVPDGRWVIAFRDRALGSSTYGQFVAWVGTYDDIRHARPGQFRIKLLHHYGSPKDGYGWANVDTGYPGMEVLPDGTVIATTYIKYWDDARRHSVVCTRFKLDELRPKPR